MSFKYYCLFASLVLSICIVSAQTQNAPPTVVAGIPVNYDEAKVGSYTLPDPLVFANSKPVRDAKTWFQKRRPELVGLFEENQFGRSPGRPRDMSFEMFDKGAPVFEGKALRRQVTIYFSKNKTGPKMDLLIYLPADARKQLMLLSLASNASAVIRFAPIEVVDSPIYELAYKGEVSCEYPAQAS
ncbi:MAG TPA: hypothetical protein VGQ39_01210 [Pyrinomonadaceae bacterium]|jgi:hypothetical protein|nr:hypothetical protein [Pyrinomonadaceae bacterium]